MTATEERLILAEHCPWQKRTDRLPLSGISPLAAANAGEVAGVFFKGGDQGIVAA